MKKTLVIVLLIIAFFFSYLLQSNFFSWFTIAGIKPNIFIILVMCVGLFAGKTTGSMLGILFGLLIDIFIGKKIGISGILLGSVGFIGGYLDKDFSKDSKLTIILMCVGVTIFYELADYFILELIYKFEIELLPLIKVILIECLYNTILIIIFYPIIQKMGYRIEEIFKGSNILTRYF